MPLLLGQDQRFGSMQMRAHTDALKQINAKVCA
jgi:hypothetical protein